MNLILDWGNTRLKTAVFQERNALEVKAFNDNYEAELTQLVNSYSFNNILISSVINIPYWFNELVKHQNVLFLNHQTSLPIAINYSTPETLGNDRIANAVAANSLSPKKNNLIIDIGTCIKFDFIDDESKYHGGAISPGFSMRLKSLNQFTDKLPLIKNSIPNNLVGNSTEQSILSGVYYGMLEEIKGIINQYESRSSNLTIFITGGDAFYFEKALKTTIFAHSFLTLYGLNEILNYNAK